MQYIKIHYYLTSALRKESESDMTSEQERKIEERFDMHIYRQLHHASFFYVLEYLYKITCIKKKDNLINNIIKWRQENKDELVWFLSRIIQDSVLFWIQLNWVWIVTYLTNVISKFLIYLKIVQKVILKWKKHLLTYCNYSMF